MTDTPLNQLCEQALNRPRDAQAIEYEHTWYTWGDLRRVADEMNALIEASGADPRAKIVLVGKNRPAAVAAYLGLVEKGYSFRMVYPFQSSTAIARDVEAINPAVVIAGSETWDSVLLGVLTDLGIAAINLNGMSAEPVPGHELSSNDAAQSPEPQIEILTSGTTGKPKPFALGYAQIAKHIIGGRPIPTSAGDHPEQLPPGMMYFPLGNITGLHSTIAPLIRGQRGMLLDRFNLEDWHDHLVRYRPVAGGLPPAGVQMALEADYPPEDFASLKMIGTGAAPLDPSVQKAFEQRYGIPIILAYGATEFGGPVASMSLELHKQYGDRKLGSVGKAMPGSDLRVVDADSGEPLPPGEQGILEVVSPRIGPEWIRTSDLAYIDADGFLFLCGRADGAIMRGGFKILPETIEKALMLHPALSAAGVVGIPDQRLGQVPAAAVQLKPGAAQPELAALESHLREHVPATHIPVRWQFVKELPRTASYKVDQPALRRLFD